MEEIKVLRKRLEKLIAVNNALCEKEIIECSQLLDKLIDRYYQELSDGILKNTKRTSKE